MALPTARVCQRIAEEATRRLRDMLRSCPAPPLLQDVDISVVEPRRDKLRTLLFFPNDALFGWEIPLADLRGDPFYDLRTTESVRRSIADYTVEAYAHAVIADELERQCDRLNERLVDMAVNNAAAEQLEQISDEIAVAERARRRAFECPPDMRLPTMFDAAGVSLQHAAAATVQVAPGNDSNTLYQNLIDAMRYLPAESRNYVREDALFRLAMDWDFGIEAPRKAEARLKRWLSPGQLEEYEKKRHFTVAGGTSGFRYRISYGQQMNIHLLDADGSELMVLCVMPEGNLPHSDCMLAQKIVLECDEIATLRKARTGEQIS
jgi:hypothetical protein